MTGDEGSEVLFVVGYEEDGEWVEEEVILTRRRLEG
jgi:hypothetical protein